MKYWSKGGKDAKETERILDAFSVLGYEVLLHTRLLYGNGRSDYVIFYTWDGDNEVHIETKCNVPGANRDYEMLERLIELDKDFVELKPDEIVIDPKFEKSDVIYASDKSASRAIVLILNTTDQCYRVKDCNGMEFTLPFSEQGKWEKVIQPKFEIDNLIKRKDCTGVAIVKEIDFASQRYVIYTDGDINYKLYLPFKEQDNWELY